MFEEKTPCKMTPHMAVERGMSMRDYSQLEHGREHNDRIAEFSALKSAKEAHAAFPGNPSRAEHAVILIAQRDHYRSFSMSNESAKIAEGFDAALRALKAL